MKINTNLTLLDKLSDKDTCEADNVYYFVLTTITALNDFSENAVNLIVSAAWLSMVVVNMSTEK